MKTINRKYRKQKVLKQLIHRYAIISNTAMNKVSIGLCEHHLYCGGEAKYSYFISSNTMEKYRIKISLYNLFHDAVCKIGYSDDYYQGRGAKLAFLTGNYKMLKRFCILHELGHIHFYQKYEANPSKLHEQFKQGAIRRWERYADAFALRYIKILEAKKAFKKAVTL